MARKERLQDPNRLGFGRLLAFKSSDIVAAWVNLIALNYLSLYASDTLGISVMTVGTLLLASKIVDAFTDVFAGWLVDNTHTKWGTGRTYEPAIVGMAICTVLLFSASPAWSNFAKCAWIFCMYTFTFSIFATLRLAGANPYTIRHFSNNPVLLKILDDNNIAIATDDVAHESRCIRVDADETGDPMMALAKQFADEDYDVLLYDEASNQNRRGEFVANLVKESGAQGLVLFMQQFCDPEEMEYPYLKKALDAAQIPHIKLGIDQQMRDFGQAATALQAFADVLSL